MTQTGDLERRKDACGYLMLENIIGHACGTRIVRWACCAFCAERHCRYDFRPIFSLVVQRRTSALSYELRDQLARLADALFLCGS